MLVGIVGADEVGLVLVFVAGAAGVGSERGLLSSAIGDCKSEVASYLLGRQRITRRRALPDITHSICHSLPHVTIQYSKGLSLSTLTRLKMPIDETRT